jgi:hypothetical protein
VPKDIVLKYKRILKLISEDKAEQLAKIVEYPLKRENPLPDISNAKEFIASYKILFDDKFKEKIKLFRDTDIFEHEGSFGLVGGPFDGDIWYDPYEEKIQTINYSSEREKRLNHQLTKQIQSKVYPSVNSWDKNILVGKSATLLIRVDWTKNDFRYVCWANGHNMSAKPDLVLNNGKVQAQGTMGGWTWTFKNGDWTYVVDDVEMCEDGSNNCGLFLRLSFKGVEKSTMRLKETK